ncbi:hypothetical protein AVEN_26749-1 [Araneus ventricosus]|uniref:Mos1 transposase HTH domain-containing protein n=1 Tax=Araneus ventricosus TaxID=182803 RepID=A0A4Y2D8B3_ARAVE|nr:hypothetical protein AVEN_26749-1 [Araneus ventricosus]
MLRKIESPAKCELRSVIRFLHAEGSNAAEIHRRMSKVYGETFMSDSKVRKWCRNFDAGRADVHDAGGQGRKPVSTDDLFQRVDQAIRGNRRFTISGLSDLFPEISRSTLYTIVSERLENRKLCARWFPKMLSDHHKTQRIGAALTFLQCYHHDGDEFLDKIVTGDETWVHYETEETKEQSKQWMHSHSPSRKPVKFKRTFSTKKCMPTVFWDVKVFSWWNSCHVAQPSLQLRTARLFNVFEGQFRTREEECCRQALSFFKTMRCRTLQLQQRSSCSVLDGKFLITHHTVLTWLRQIFISLPT